MIYANEVYKYLSQGNENSSIRIIAISQDTNTFYYITLYTHFSMPISYEINTFLDELAQGLVIKVSDPYLKRLDEDALSDAIKERRDFDWNIVNRYWEQEKENILLKSTRRAVFNRIGQENALSDSRVKRLFTRFWQKGMSKNAMLLDYSNSGGKGKDKVLKEDSRVGRPKRTDDEGNSIAGINITPEIKELFQNAIDRYYRTGQQTSLTEVYHTILKEFFSDQYMENREIRYQVWSKERIPTYRQFYYWFKKLEDPVKNIIERQGIKEYELKHRPILSNSTIQTIGPGTRFEVDATIADVYLVSKLDRNRIIGRPIVYAIIDVFSRLVTGIYVGLEGPSWIGAMMALDNMVSDKVEFCKQYGIEIDDHQWPARHLPEIILADRGEFEGYSVENLINNLGIAIENTPPYRGDLKGIVERSFRTLNTKLKHKTPGAIMKEFRSRGDRDYRLDAKLTLEEFTKIYIQLVIHHNNTPIAKYSMEKEMLASSIVPIPTLLWQWGIENKKGSLRTIEREIMRLNVLPKAKASVSRAGIKFKNLMYGSQRAIQEQWFINQKIKSIEIVYDPRNMNSIYIPEEGGREYEACYLLEASQRYKDIILEEIVFMNELQAELLEKQRREQLQSNIDLDSKIEMIVKEAQKEKAKSTILYDQSKTSKLKSIKKNREVEKEINKVSEAFELGTPKSERPVKVTELKKQEIADDITLQEELSPKQKLMNKLKQKRDENRGTR